MMKGGVNPAPAITSAGTILEFLIKGSGKYLENIKNRGLSLQVKEVFYDPAPD